MPPCSPLRYQKLLLILACKHRDVYKVLLHLFIEFESNYCLPHKQLGEECDEKLQDNLHLPCVSNNEKIIIEKLPKLWKKLITLFFHILASK